MSYNALFSEVMKQRNFLKEKKEAEERALQALNEPVVEVVTNA
jgi:hypothetical protein